MENTEAKDLSSLKRSRSAHAAQLSKLYKELEESMISSDNADTANKLYKKLCDKFESFSKVHLECLDVCTDTGVVERLEKDFDSCQKNFIEFQDRFSQWNTANEKTPDDDQNSFVSRISVSTTDSSRSSRSKLKCAKAKRLVAEHKLKCLREMVELERVQKELEIKKQLLESESELEQAQIEESVWQESMEELTGDENGTKEDRTRNTGSEQEAEHSRREQDICTSANNQTPRNVQNNTSDLTLSSIDEAFQRLSTTLHEGFNLPKPEVLRFNGSSLEYCKFVRNFESNIESRVSDDRLRLSYLIQYCDGEAKNAIEDCVLLEPNAGYRRARDILYSRYGRPYTIARSHIDKLVQGPSLKASDTVGLSNLALEMQRCEITLSQLGFKSDIDNTDNLRRIVRRLPMHVRGKWADIAHSISESGREPRFSDLAKFVDEKARVASSMYGLDLAKESSHGKTVDSKSCPTYKPRVTTLATNSLGDKDVKTSTWKCCCCSGKCPNLASCQQFTSMTLSDREMFVRKLKLCYNCLKGKHFSNTCRKPPGCTVPECKYKHHVLLHSWVNLKSDHTVSQSSVNFATSKGTVIKNCLGIIPVTILGGHGQSCQTYALLDDGADKTLCDERLLKSLDLCSKPVKFMMSTVSSAGSTVEGQEVDLQVRASHGDGGIVLRKVWSVKSIPISTRSIPKNSDFRNLPYLSDIHIPEIDANSVMLLIGTDAPEAHIPLEVRSGNHDQPYAIKTKLGWAVRGPVFDTDRRNRISVNFEQSYDMLLQNQLEKMWNTDFDDKLRTENIAMSLEDKRALKTMENSVKHENGHYKLKLPWRDEEAIMPNNLALAYARLEHLKRKLSRDPELHTMYTATVSDYIQKGYAAEVTISETDAKRVWYLPHHPVTNPNKPGKVRVVFDCAAQYKGISLNSQLLQGPDLMNSLVGVLIRFRQERIAVAADIEAMFHQVRVQDEDCDALRFLWWPGGDISQQPRCYRMQVHLFGATSSPSCTAFALRRTATDHVDSFEPEVISTVKRNFYVDDCLKSVSSEERAMELATDLQSLMKKGGFRLTKWLSNSRKVVDSITEPERAPSVVNLDKGETLPIDRALGVYWDVDKDTITFKVKLSNKPLSRRGILSVVSSIFDPLGLLSPVILPARSIVQRLCKQKLGWDDPIPEKDANEWRHWLDTLPFIEQISIRRCFKPDSFRNVKNAQLHIFCDGSELGYGACAYLRLVDENGLAACCLVLGKSRLAPINQKSIPRLELCGAVVASRLYRLIADELEIGVSQVTFWTDSMITLGYIKNESRRFKTFVGNRVGQIHDLTSPDQWRHVDTHSNPADIASRGIDARDAEHLKFWLYGPDFLLKDEEYWPKQSLPPEIDEDDQELKKQITVYTMNSDFPKLTNYFSDWTKLKRATAWLLRFKEYCRRRYLKQNNTECKTGNLTVYELQNAENTILCQVQESCFKSEMKALKNQNVVQKSSRIASLNPTLQNGLIRTNGRVITQQIRPIILPSEHHVTKLIISSHHESLGHTGTQQVLASIREKYWIIKGHASVKKVIKSCVMCKRLHGPLSSQQMAPLLEEQTTADMPPFTFVGIDYFGPLMVKTGSARAKRYGCLFTCLTSRAVHLEIAHSLSTDSFISAFQRFMSRRGLPKKVFSDNGSNFVSGEQELRKTFKKWNQSKIAKYMTHKEIEWHFNPPCASHMGGAWERLIRSTRMILKSLTKEQLLNDEQLLTLMAETEKILNDRPLTPVSCDPRDPPALTPNTLLLMKHNQPLPVGLFKKDDAYAKRWWRQVQYLADIFWKRWLREYLPLLQKRQKWQRKTMDLKKGDVVLVATEKAPRGQWPLARVVDINVGRDGLTRSCVVRTQFSQFVRPITKLCLLESSV